MSAFVDGLVAGYGVAIPVGAVSVLIVNLALERGFRLGFMAGAGTAFVDFVSALITVFAGTAVIGFLLPYQTPLVWISAGVLIAMGIWGLMTLWRPKEDRPSVAPKDGKVFLQFVAITALNPFTAIYFMALIMGNGGDWNYTFGDCLWFVAGVTFASLSWQIVLAGIGSVARQHISPRFMRGTIIVGNLLVVALGIKVLLF